MNIFLSLLLFSSALSYGLTIKNIPFPNSASAYAACKPGTSSTSVAHCLNWLVRQKDSAPLDEKWVITIASGQWKLKESIVIFNAHDIDIKGASTTPSQTELIANGLPANRGVHQYFSVIIMNAKNINLSYFKLNGNLLSGQRGITVCATQNAISDQTNFTSMELKNYNNFNVIVGNGISQENLGIIATYSYPTSDPLYYWIHSLKGIDKPFCGGPTKNLKLSNSKIYMRSVGFYLVPPSGLSTKSYPVSSPNPNKASTPTWYSAAKTYAGNFSGIIVDHNTFQNDLTDPSQVDLNMYHSAMKLTWSSGTQITFNTINASTLPNAYGSGAAINLGAGTYNATVKGNTITLPAGSPYPYGIGVQSYYETHPTYGFGNLEVFGAISDIFIRENNLVNARIRFADCCIQNGSGAPNYRPYCQERDSIVSKHAFDENIWLSYNRMNGRAYMDQNLIWRQSAQEPSWVQYYQSLGAMGQGGISCRQYMGVTYQSANGVKLN